MFTVDELIAEVRKLANENPNFVYDEEYCFYTRGGDCDNPGCLIGRAIVNLDKSLKSVLAEMDNEGCFGVKEVLRELDVEYSSWLDIIQDKQDCGNSWKYSLDYADEAYPLD